MLFYLIQFLIKGILLILRPQIEYFMTLNRFIFILLAAVVVLSGCKKSNQFTISGKITHAEGDTIRLEELLVSTQKPLAKMKMDKNGNFKFKGETSIPTFYLLKLSNDNFITLLVDSTENVTIEADIANFNREYNLEGSLGSIQIKELNETLYKTEHKLDSVKSLMTLSRGTANYDKMLPQWQEAISKIKEEQSKFSNQFVLNNPFSMASVYALYQKYKDKTYVIRDLQTMRTAASALNSIYPNSDLVKALYENTLQFLRQEQANKVRQFIDENGENSPDINLPNEDGKNVALSSLRGKVVLLQFWDAQDRESRIVNQLLVDAYRKYKSKGFEIYQVNTGKNRSEWLDAIDTDNLTWINVGDMEGSVNAVNAFNIQTIPYNYLLDRDGAIVAKNLRSTALDSALGQLLK